MSKVDAESFFDQYVTGFMFADVQREIDRARDGQDAVTFLRTCPSLLHGGAWRNPTKHACP